ncbi:Arabinanase/levansucrase/invertase [Trichodelitschia bisporula]|uniref:Arabinanase/levansucrase/invertase n=1 Tax=Trichodelitschia bisporula TaxID=703511 RepID=A0A6G1HL50_9PEZI|nr:Arabinanase/levansucrase/invertase [Trichodelitschia bisporula]
MIPRSLLAWLLPVLTILLLTLTSPAAARNFTNPLLRHDGSDPFITLHAGYYYLTTTTWKDVQISRARTLAGLKSSPERKVVWKDSNKNRCCNVWAPEIHQIDGTWYVYYTAGAEKDLGLQRPYVLRGGASPWDSYTFLGQLSNEWGIDGTVSTIGRSRYFLWSCQRGGLQSICIAPLLSPSRIGAVKLISQPTRAWEKAEGKLAVNEGPAVFTPPGGGRVFVTFSASYCWTPSYSLGLLTLRDGGDPLDAKAWTKSGPVFKSANGNWGPGHNGFFPSPDGTEVWNVYHATTAQKGACDGNRYTAAQVVRWTRDGMPDFGAPAALSTVLKGPSGEGGPLSPE